MSNYHTHTAAVEQLVAHGIPAPRGWSELRDRMREAEALQRPMFTSYVTAVIGGDHENLAMLRALALSEEIASDGRDYAHSMNESVRATVGDQLRRLYAPVAQGNYSTAAKNFDEVARDHASGVPMPAELVDDALELLVAAAYLAGAPRDHNKSALMTDEYRIPLVCDDSRVEDIEVEVVNGGKPVVEKVYDDAGRAHARPVTRKVTAAQRVWQAWHSADRWGELVSLGVKLRAHPKPAALQPYSPDPDVRQYPLVVGQPFHDGTGEGVRMWVS